MAHTQEEDHKNHYARHRTPTEVSDTCPLCTHNSPHNGRVPITRLHYILDLFNHHYQLAWQLLYYSEFGCSIGSREEERMDRFSAPISRFIETLTHTPLGSPGTLSRLPEECLSVQSELPESNSTTTPSSTNRGKCTSSKGSVAKLSLCSRKQVTTASCNISPMNVSQNRQEINIQIKNNFTGMKKVLIEKILVEESIVHSFLNYRKNIKNYHFIKPRALQLL